MDLYIDNYQCHRLKKCIYEEINGNELKDLIFKCYKFHHKAKLELAILVNIWDYFYIPLF